MNFPNAHHNITIQMSWLYKISGHPLFSSILHYLRVRASNVRVCVRDALYNRLLVLWRDPCTCCAIARAQESQDILVLTTSSLVVASLIPLIPSYLGSYIRDLMDIFYRLATIRSTHIFGREGYDTWRSSVAHISVPQRAFPPSSIPIWTWLCTISSYSCTPCSLSILCTACNRRSSCHSTYTTFRNMLL